MRCFAPFFMRESDDCYLLHGRVSQKRAFNLNRRDVFTAAYDDVSQAVANFDVTIRMHNGGITGVKPSAVHSSLRRFGVVVVAGHDHVTAGNDLTLSNPVVRHIVTFGVYY